MGPEPSRWNLVISTGNEKNIMDRVRSCTRNNPHALHPRSINLVNHRSGAMSRLSDALQHPRRRLFWRTRACPPKKRKNECSTAARAALRIAEEPRWTRQQQCLISASIPQNFDGLRIPPPEMNSTHRSINRGGGGGNAAHLRPRRDPKSHAGARATSSYLSLSLSLSRSRASVDPLPPSFAAAPVPTLYFLSPPRARPSRPHFLRGNFPPEQKIT